ncbi:MAG: hypothetical protein EOP11_23710 [Proteobacteria bacterium]|nr:MAG: hypothetical protein EOP11_23710 [Pseudomonadota bacterium]
MSLLLTIALSSAVAAKPAHALGLGDSALTVAIATGAGAGLGASTLPFYSDAGAHTKNIFYGAAIGAVFGVLITAAAGVTAPESADEALSTKKAEGLLAKAQRLQPDAVLNSNARKKEETLFWSPLAKLEF